MRSTTMTAVTAACVSNESERQRESDDGWIHCSWVWVEWKVYRFLSLSSSSTLPMCVYGLVIIRRAILPIDQCDCCCASELHSFQAFFIFVLYFTSYTLSLPIYLRLGCCYCCRCHDTIIHFTSSRILPTALIFILFHSTWVGDW